MCLVASKGSRKIANKNIHVYKIVKLRGDKNHWDGPFHGENFPFEELLEMDSPDECFLLGAQNQFSNTVICGAGFYHAYLTLEAAKCSMSGILKIAYDSMDEPITYEVVEATIPKGSTYYTSMEEDGKSPTEIATSKLIVHRKNPEDVPIKSFVD